MYPSVSETASFSFITKFSNLDGIYLVQSIHTLGDLLASGVDLVNMLYAKADPVLGKEDYIGDLEDIEDDKFYKLQHVTTKDVIYVPIFFMSEIPDPNVYKYLKLGFAVEIGVFADQGKLDWIKSQIGQHLAAVAGVEKSPDLFEIKQVWMTESDYEAIESAREATIEGVTNHYTDAQALLIENTRLKTLVDQYEATLIALST